MKKTILFLLPFLFVTLSLLAEPPHPNVPSRVAKRAAKKVVKSNTTATTTGHTAPGTRAGQVEDRADQAKATVQSAQEQLTGAQIK